jgi:SAM-dependent methyltransferase
MGGALVAFKFDGCTTIGCDWGEQYTARARSLGLDVRTGGLETLADEEPFDLIILSHVLEHVSDPITFASQIGSLLAEDGLLHIELPGILNIAVGYDGNLLDYLQSAHLWHFTQSTLTATLARAGLAVAQCDETITCVAQRSATSLGDAVDRTHGAAVLAELDRLEQNRTVRIAA